MNRREWNQALILVFIALGWFHNGYMYANRQHRKANIVRSEKTLAEMKEINRNLREAIGR
jgi:hypothetical protein